MHIVLFIRSKPQDPQLGIKQLGGLPQNPRPTVSICRVFPSGHVVQFFGVPMQVRHDGSHRKHLLLASSCAGSAQALQTGLKLASAVQFVHK